MVLVDGVWWGPEYVLFLVEVFFVLVLMMGDYVGELEDVVGGMDVMLDEFVLGVWIVLFWCDELICFFFIYVYYDVGVIFRC